MSDAKLLSSAFYLLVFASSIACYYLAEIAFRDKKRRGIAFLFAVVATLIPVFVAGLRGDNVGRDVVTYILPNMDAAVSCSSFVEVGDAIDSGGEWGYVGLLFWLSRMFSDAGPLLFVLQLLTIGPLAIAAFLLKDRVSPALAMSIYLFCFFNVSLNMMRQFVAVAFIVLAWVLYVRQGRLSFGVILSAVTACLFHKSGVLGVCMVVGIDLLGRRFTRPFDWRVFVVLVVAVLFLGRYMGSIMEFASSLNNNFKGYANVFVFGTEDRDWFVNPFGAFALTRLFLDVVLVCFPVVMLRLCNEQDGCLIVSVSAKMCVIGLMLSTAILFGLNTPYGVRFSIYWDVFIFVFAPIVLARIGRGNLAVATYLGFLVFYWFIRTIRLDDDSVVVYTFRI